MGAKFEDGWSSDNKTKPKIEKANLKEPNKHSLYFAKEKRRGKVVTVIKEFFLEPKELKSILQQLKKELGCGGTIKQNSIELQGEVEQSAKEILKKLGFRFKR